MSANIYGTINNNENKKESTSSVGHNKFTIQFKEQILDLACRCVVLP